MKFNSLIFKLLLIEAIKVKCYITDLSLVECEIPITDNSYQQCQDLMNKESLYNTEDWKFVDFDINQFDSSQIKYRYLFYKENNNNNPSPAILNLSVSQQYTSLSNCQYRLSKPLKEVDKDETEYTICYDIDKNNTPSPETKVVVDVKFTTNNVADKGYELCNIDINTITKVIDQTQQGPNNNPNNGPTINPNADPNFSNGGGNNNSNNNFGDFGTIQNNNNNNQNNNGGFFFKRDNVNQIYLQFKKDFPKTITKTVPKQTTIQNEVESQTNSTNPNKQNDNPSNDENQNNNGVQKTFIILSVVSISAAVSILVFVTVNKRRRFNEEKETEQLFNSLPWKTSPNNPANESFSDSIYGASLPQMENALSNNRNINTEASLNRNNMQNTFNRNANNYGTLNSVGYGTMNTLSSRGTMGTMHSMNSLGGGLTGQPVQQSTMPPMNNNMNNMNPGIPPNQNYPPPNGLGFINQQNINLPPMTAPSINAGLNITLSTSPLSNVSNYQNNNNTIPPANYNINYQPTIPTTQVQDQQQNFDTIHSQVTTNSQGTMNNRQAGFGTMNSANSNNTVQSSSNSANSNDKNPDVSVMSDSNSANNSRLSMNVQSHKQPNNVKKRLYITNGEDEPENSKSLIDNDKEKLLGSSKLISVDEEENDENDDAEINKENKEINGTIDVKENKEKLLSINSHLIINENNSLNLPSSLQIDKLDSSLNLTGIEFINSIEDLVDENNNINPKRVSKRESTANGINQQTLSTGNDENIPVIAGYDAQKLDELTLTLGDIITVNSVYSDGWGFGINNSTNEKGYFPIVCLERKPNMKPIV